MKFSEFIQAQHPFSGSMTNFTDAKYVILGIPFDLTSTYRFGSREAPDAIREASLNIETYSFRAKLYLEDIKIHDLGNMQLKENIEENALNLRNAISYILSEKKHPITLGGEHSLTYSVINALPDSVGVVSFDAHFDLRDEYDGRKFSHATFMRRAVEKIGLDHVLFVGIRAVCKEEIDYVNTYNAQYLTPDNFKKQKLAIKKINEFANRFSEIYITIDMDAFDPSFAPGVANPEPGGITLENFLEAIYNLTTEIIGFDVVEVTPKYDIGITTVFAARIIFEVLCSMEKSFRPI